MTGSFTHLTRPPQISSPKTSPPSASRPSPTSASPRRSARVRGTAVLGVLKLYRLQPSTAVDSGLLNDLHALLDGDVDPLVRANVLQSLLSMPGHAPAPERDRVYAFLGRIREFPEWSQCAILEWASKCVQG